jgi:hypothetical protein
MRISSEIPIGQRLTWLSRPPVRRGDPLPWLVGGLTRVVRSIWPRKHNVALFRKSGRPRLVAWSNGIKWEPRLWDKWFKSKQDR